MFPVVSVAARLKGGVRRLLMRDQVDQCRYLNLRELSEPEDNSLRLVVEELHVDDEADELVVGESSFGLTHKVEYTEACRVFELTWDMYVAYSVLNESYVRADDTEAFTGRRVRHYSRSRFLEHVRSETWADHQYPGPSIHTAIVCENHIVNVISVVEPQVRLLKPGQPRAVPDA